MKDKPYDAQEKLDALRYFLGHIEDASSESILICQDDATKTFHAIRPNKVLEIEYGDSWNDLLDKLVERYYRENHIDPLTLSKVLVNADSSATDSKTKNKKLPPIIDEWM